MVLKIPSKIIEKWSDCPRAREYLPILIRRLIRETIPSNSIIDMNFPGNVQKPGFDGTLESNSASQYIPKGNSVWEIGTSADSRKKAISDFKKRESQANKNTSFIFVSSRDLNNKDQLFKEKNGWKEVLALDASDLEQWLERAPYTSVWLSEIMKIPQNHLVTPENFLKDWFSDTEPKFNTKFLFSNRVLAKNSLTEFLKKNKLSSALSILADTRNEATAFISAVIMDNGFSDLPAVILKNKESCIEVEGWHSINNIPSILISHSKEVARNISTKLLDANILIISEVREIHENNLKSRKIDTRNFQSTQSIILPRPQIEGFRLIFGNNFNKTKTQYIKTGGSVSALHRVLSINPAKRDPEWTKINKNDKNAIWLSLIGCWDELYEGDRKIICGIADIEDYNIWDKFINSLKEAEETPLEMTSGDKRGYRLFSRVEAFSAISSKIRSDDIDRFLNIAEKVLGDEDPNYPCASGYDSIPNFNQNRYYSDLLRKGIVDGLIILNLNNDMLICGNIKDRITNFYSKIFSSDRSWYFLLDVLPKLAEASPNDFVRVLKKTLNSYPEKLEVCFTPKRNFLMFNDYQHHHLLWALELLAWQDDRLDSILNLLCEIQIKFEDKISNNCHDRPSESLKTILRYWMPQTAANVEQRKKAIDDLYAKFSYQTASLALAICHKDDRTAKSAHIPIWRDDALNIKPVSRDDELVIFTKFKDIITRFISDESQSLEHRLAIAEKSFDNFDHWECTFVQKVADSILNLPNNNHDVTDSIRNHAKTVQLEIIRLKRGDISQNQEIATGLLEKITEHFSGKDIVRKYAYLFSRFLRSTSDDESQFQKKCEAQESEQRDVIEKIYNDRKIDGLIELFNLSEDSSMISKSLYIALIDKGKLELEEYLIELLNSNVNLNSLRQHLYYIFGWTVGKNSIPDALDAVKVIEIIDKAKTKLETSKNNEDIIKKKIALLHALRIDQKEGRDYIDNLSALLKKQYFSCIRNSLSIEKFRRIEDKDTHFLDNTWLVDGYIKHKRPRLGWLSCIHLKCFPFEKQLDLLDSMLINESDEGVGQDPIPQSYDIEQILEKASKQDLDDVAEGRYFRIEYKFYRLIDYKFRNGESSFVERRIGKKPEFFVKLHKYIYKTDDGEVMFPDNIDADMAKAHRDIARDVLYHLNLCSINYSWRLENGNLNKLALYDWILDVRELAKEAKMTKSIDDSIGQGFGRGTCLSGNLRPALAICSILENIHNKQVSEGFLNGCINARGVMHDEVDDKGFTNEDLATKYDKLSDDMLDDFPFVADIMSSLASSYRDSDEKDKEIFDRLNLNRY